MKDFDVEDLNTEEKKEKAELTEKEREHLYKKLKKDKPKKRFKNEKVTSVLLALEKNDKVRRLKFILSIVIWIMLAVELVLGTMFIVKLGMMHFLPTKYYVIGIVVYVLLNAFFVFWNIKRRLLITEIIVIGAFILLLLYPNHALYKLDSVLHKMNANSNVEVSQFSLVVLANDPAQSIEDLGGYTISYAANAKHVDEAIGLLDEMVSSRVQYKQVDDQIALAYELLEKNVKCILIASEYLDVINDIEDLDVFAAGTRVVGTIDTEHIVEPEPEPEPDTEPQEEEKTQYVFYISGIDTYGSINRVSRSDVNILAFVNLETGCCQLISTPRDSFVECPLNGYERDKLTNCGLYGIGCSEDTLKYLYGGEFQIDYYMRVNFSGFIKIIDELGGVDVYSDRSFTSVDGYHYSKGNLHLNGTEALHFARERKAFAAGAIARDNHQMDVIQAVIKKMTSSTKMLNNFGNILDAVSESFETDMPANVMYEFINYQLSNEISWDVKTFTMNGEGARSKECFSQKGRNTFVLHLDQDMLKYAKELIKANRMGYNISDYEGREY